MPETDPHKAAQVIGAIVLLAAITVAGVGYLFDQDWAVALLKALSIFSLLFFVVVIAGFLAMWASRRKGPGPK